MLVIGGWVPAGRHLKSVLSQYCSDTVPFEHSHRRNMSFRERRFQKKLRQRRSVVCVCCLFVYFLVVGERELCQLLADDCNVRVSVGVSDVSLSRQPGAVSGARPDQHQHHLITSYSSHYTTLGFIFTFSLSLSLSLSLVPLLLDKSQDCHW